MLTVIEGGKTEPHRIAIKRPDYTADDMAMLASFYAGLAVAADDAAKRAKFAADRHYHTGRADTWRKAAEMIETFNRTGSVE